MQDESGCCYLHCISALTAGAAWARWEDRSQLAAGACPQSLHSASSPGRAQSLSSGLWRWFPCALQGPGSRQPFPSVVGLIPKQQQTVLPAAGTRTAVCPLKPSCCRPVLRAVRSRVTVCHGGITALIRSELQPGVSTSWREGRRNMFLRPGLEQPPACAVGWSTCPAQSQSWAHICSALCPCLVTRLGLGVRVWCHRWAPSKQHALGALPSARCCGDTAAKSITAGRAAQCQGPQGRAVLTGQVGETRFEWWDLRGKTFAHHLAWSGWFESLLQGRIISRAGSAAATCPLHSPAHVCREHVLD